ncbi:6237_t:CDS:1, partial [Funneliformis mosseae]
KMDNVSESPVGIARSLLSDSLESNIRGRLFFQLHLGYMMMLIGFKPAILPSSRGKSDAKSSSSKEKH